MITKCSTTQKLDFLRSRQDIKAMIKLIEACLNAELFLIYKGNGVNQSGNPAAVSSEYWDLGRWLCVPLFRVVCLYLTFIFISVICSENLNKIERNFIKQSESNDNYRFVL